MPISPRSATTAPVNDGSPTSDEDRAMTIDREYQTYLDQAQRRREWMKTGMKTTDLDTVYLQAAQAESARLRHEMVTHRDHEVDVTYYDETCTVCRTDKALLNTMKVSIP
jgi:hypothetical protein